MKKLIYLFAAVSALAFTGCSDDENTNNDINPPDYSGPWALINVSGSIAGVSDDIENVTWNFNTDENTVTVTNANTDETDEDFFENGTYSVTLQEDENAQDCNYNLRINSTDFGCIAIDGDAMTFTQQAADGYILTFEKVPFFED